jgi:hypothetical protein
MVTGFGVEADRAIVKVSFTKKHSAPTSIPGLTIMFLNNGAVITVNGRYKILQVL